MPTRKQRRRRQKLQRHEYEEVYVDAEGREVEVDEAELEAPPQHAARAAAKSGRRPERAPKGVQPPSWRRVGRRSLIFAPLMLLLVVLLEPNLSRVGQVTLTLWMVLMFAPFSYVMDMIAHRMWRRRAARDTVRARTR